MSKGNFTNQNYKTLRYIFSEQSPVSLDLCLRKTQSGKSNGYRDYIVSVSSIFKTFFVHTKMKIGLYFSNSSGLKSVLEKAPFSWRVSVDGPNHRKKSVCSNFSGLVWMPPRLIVHDVIGVSLSEYKVVLYTVSWYFSMIASSDGAGIYAARSWRF